MAPAISNMEHNPERDRHDAVETPARASLAIPTKTHKELRARLPGWSKADHLEAAQRHKQAALDCERAWLQLQELAHWETYGASPDATSYQVSGVGDDLYPSALKDALRTLAHRETAHWDRAALHWRIAHPRTPFRRLLQP
jgi:hypothetical protein